MHVKLELKGGLETFWLPYVHTIVNYYSDILILLSSLQCTLVFISVSLCLFFLSTPIYIFVCIRCVLAT